MPWISYSDIESYAVIETPGSDTIDIYLRDGTPLERKPRTITGDWHASVAQAVKVLASPPRPSSMPHKPPQLHKRSENTWYFRTGKQYGYTLIRESDDLVRIIPDDELKTEGYARKLPDGNILTGPDTGGGHNRIAKLARDHAISLLLEPHPSPACLAESVATT